MRAVQGHVTLVAATALVIGLAACNSTEAPTGVLRQQGARGVADVVVADAASLAGAAAYNTTSGVAMASAPASTTTSQPCPAISPLPVVNSDGDMPPDSVHFDFTGCIIQRPLETVTLSGMIDFVDPTPTVPDHSHRTRFTDFTRTVTKLLSGRTTSIELNGVRTFTGTADALEHSETNFRTDYTYADGSTATHVKTWSSTFTADVPGSIQLGSPLPSGTWTITGTSTWTRADRTYSLSVTTNPPLHYNADCTVAPKFDAGTITAVVTPHSPTMNITLQVTARRQHTGARRRAARLW